MTNPSLPNRIDFIPLTGIDDLAEASRRFGRHMATEVSELTDGTCEQPGELKQTRLLFEGYPITTPAWRGAQWSEDGETRAALDTISEDLVQAFPDLPFLLIRREGGVAQVSFRWAATMKGEDCLGFEVQSRSNGLSRKNADGDVERVEGDTAELEKIAVAGFVHFPQAAEYWRGRAHAEQMDKTIPDAPDSDFSRRPKPRV